MFEIRGKELEALNSEGIEKMQRTFGGGSALRRQSREEKVSGQRDGSGLASGALLSLIIWEGSQVSSWSPSAAGVCR